MAELKKQAVPEVVVADPRQWREQDQESITSWYKTDYRDIYYQCWTCRTASVFTAADQKSTYEVRKAPIDQRRKLCEDCHRAGREAAAAINAREAQWAGSKQALVKDAAFLADWLALLMSVEKYGRRPNTAAKNMLKKLLEKIDGM